MKTTAELQDIARNLRETPYPLTLSEIFILELIEEIIRLREEVERLHQDAAGESI